MRKRWAVRNEIFYINLTASPCSINLVHCDSIAGNAYAGGDMMRVIFARIGWMKRYFGPQPDDEKPIGGGSYNENDLGLEAYNFLQLNDHMLGYFQPKLRKNHPSTLALERIEAGFDGKALNGVLTVFVATDPKRGGQRIVGWYRDATVYRDAQLSNDKRRGSFSYFLKTRAENAVPIPEPKRECMIPGGLGAFGQANVCYALDSNGQPKKDAGWIEEALKYIASYDLENSGQEPASEVDPAIEEILGSAIENFAGFQSNPRIRRAIEMYAMGRAEKHLRKLGYEPQDMHKTKSYDFCCNVSGTELYVEVKGTQDDGNSVCLTPKEVEHAQKHQNSALFIVHSVKVEGKRKPVVSGGKDVFLHPWDISTGTLKPHGYVYTL
jgi:hypothetical protein